MPLATFSIFIGSSDVRAESGNGDGVLQNVQISKELNCYSLRQSEFDQTTDLRPPGEGWIGKTLEIHPIASVLITANSRE
jgi:hypothetical protein